MLIALILGLAQQETEPPKLQIPNRQPIFAFAKASQDGKSIAISAGKRRGTRRQTYTVNVPVVETRVDGNGNERQVTVMRTETRMREVGSRATMVPVEYTVERPIQRQVKDKDGTVSTQTIRTIETRTRMVPIGTKDGKPDTYKLSDCKITDLHGKPVVAAEVAKRLSKSSPVVLLYGKQTLDPFYEVALNPNMLLVHPPLPKLPPNASSSIGTLSDDEYARKMKEAEKRVFEGRK